MARAATDPGRHGFFPESMAQGLRRRASEGLGLLALAASAILGLALFTYASTDPSWNTASDGAVSNLIGLPGAVAADLLLQSLGAAAGLPILVLGAWAWRLVVKKTLDRIWLRGVFLLLGMVLGAIAAGALPVPQTWSLHMGLGGAVGWALLPFLAGKLALLGLGFETPGIAILSGLLGTGALVYAAGLSASEWRVIWRTGRWLSVSIWRRIGGALARLRAQPRAPRDGISAAPGAARARPRRRPGKAKKGAPVVEEKKTRAPPGKRARDARQGSLHLPLADRYQLPPLDLLEAPPGSASGSEADHDALAQNAKLLETVLDDFGVRGEIVKVRPGPVVTLYELEPAPGIKTSRVIGLADDIARSMSALSVRIAVVPGRSVIGIELPNQRRDMVYFRELLASRAFERNKGALALALGKDIGGAPIVVDLAGMPHLLIAGTTGSGKSVAINTMILSLLYQYGPEHCRFIMVDPKMLELSVYDGIPSLLTPVVTDPSKAIVALKWAVREMEERYRAMAQLGVRNITGYNARLAEAAKTGESLSRRVQTGFGEDGRAVFEDQPLSLEPLPLIVVVVDEMADLMMVAGKEIEAAIQRLAQMARAAGIHLIMATQRPSVDVITGTIKANFPTRISFHVASKIDSRTILGEQGAEQLLGRGDMLYMAGGTQIRRIHGPFVSDAEVETVVTYLKAQGEPEYDESVTEDDENPFAPPGMDGGDAGDALYDEAVAIIAREGKASTSFIQRHLQIGYNRAARIIERMEEQGVVSRADRVGRREVLIGSMD